MSRYDVLREYERTFDDGLPFFGLPDEQFEWMLKEAEKAVNGERAAVSFDEIQRATGSEPKTGIDY